MTTSGDNDNDLQSAPVDSLQLVTAFISLLINQPFNDSGWSPWWMDCGDNSGSRWQCFTKLQRQSH